jgi:hypothetical protein
MQQDSKPHNDNLRGGRSEGRNDLVCILKGFADFLTVDSVRCIALRN